MDMEEDVDDPMELDETLQVGAIIERKSDEFSSTDVETTTVASFNESTIEDLNPETPSTEDAYKTSSEDANKASLADAAQPSKTEFFDKLSSAVPDIVILDDDDESQNGKAQNVEMEDIIDLVEKPTVRCLNSTCCGTNTDFLLAPDFCLNYYRVKRSKSNKEEICQTCYEKTVEDYDVMSSNLASGKLILEQHYPIINETVQIEDSSEEESDEEVVEYINKENFDFISQNIDEIIQETLDKFKVQEHYKMETEYLKREALKSQEDVKDVSNQLSQIRTTLDRIQIDLYNQFRPDFRTLRGLSITDDVGISPNILIKTESSLEPSPRKSTRSHKPVSYVELDEMGNSNSPAVATPPVPETEPPKDLPEVVPIVRSPAQPGEIYYIVRENTQSNWIRARLQNLINPGTPYNGQTYVITHYKLVELKQQKERIVSGRQMAYLNQSKVRLPVGTRVISMFKETSLGGQIKKPRTDPYYAGVVAEQPFEGNRYRYLIFFDIGYSQYVSYNCVNLVLESSQNVWEDIYIDSRAFIKKYLESQDRPMVKLAKDQTVRVEYNGKWWLCRVINVDCSLVQVLFEQLNRAEWIYRGSTRLSPMFREEQAATNRGSGVRTSRKLGPNESQTVVQYTRKDDIGQPIEGQPLSQGQESPTNVRAVARKSTTRPQAKVQIEGAVPFLPQVKDTPPNVTGPTSKIMYFTPRDQVIIRRQYKPHNCTSKCKEFLTHNFSQLRGHNPLSKPLLCGWARMTLKGKSRKEIIYKAPCGRVIRSIAEVHVYLRVTRSDMTVDLFDFNHMVRCLAEFSVDCVPDPKDLSRSMEQVPIPVINGINNEMLDFCNYSIKRVPMEDVPMNLDQDFLCGCDCDDDCIDKTKCACWRLTLEGAKFIGKDGDPNSVGYIYRRLPEQVITGIYECNSKCKCSNTCLNRVVQNPMSLKLQVFRTLNRGWGIRCLNDVPQGSFICIYAGTIHTEAMANEDGVAYGDEYFAELDYIETVEKYKEDYEAEVLEEEEEERYNSRSRKSPVEEDDEEENMLRRMASNSRSKRYNYSEDNDFVPSNPDRIPKDSSIRTRLRKRNQDDDYDEKVKKDLPKAETKQEHDIRIKKEIVEARAELKATLDGLPDDIETVTISDEEDEGREVLSFNPKASGFDDKGSNYISVRDLYEKNSTIYIMDAKNAGNIGRFLNHSCSPNVFVQNVFVDTHDPRFPWVSFFSSQFIRAGTELTWNYNYDIGSVPGRVLYCHCSSLECKGRLL